MPDLIGTLERRPENSRLPLFRIISDLEHSLMKREGDEDISFDMVQQIVVTVDSFEHVVKG